MYIGAWVLAGSRGFEGHSGFTRVSERRGEERTNEFLKMPEILFPEKWWQMSQTDYDEAKGNLKGLIHKEGDSGNAEVNMREME